MEKILVASIFVIGLAAASAASAVTNGTGTSSDSLTNDEQLVQMAQTTMSKKLKKYTDSESRRDKREHAGSDVRDDDHDRNDNDRNDDNDHGSDNGESIDSGSDDGGSSDDGGNDSNDD